jgi:hypothetical protein
MTADEVRALLRREIDQTGSAKAWAEQNGVSAQYVSDTLNARREPSHAIMKALGLERETVYRRAGA